MYVALAATLAAPFAGAAPVEAQSAARVNYLQAADYSEGERGIAVLVMVDGRVVFEQYANGGSAGRAHLLASGTKSFVGPLAIAAQQDGLLSLDEPVSATLHEWRNDPQRAAVTIRQLLTLTGGIESQAGLVPPSYAESVIAPLNAEPGTRFQYGAAPFQIFGELLRRKLAPQGETVAAYVQRRILAPIGLRTGFWRGMAQGEPQLPAGAYLTAREWAKFGEFVRNAGAWEGQQLFPADEMAAMLRGTSANPAYGLTWWLNVPTLPELRGEIQLLRRNLGGVEHVPGLEGMVVAAGAFKQRLYIIPSRRMVVVRFGNSVGEQFDDGRFLGLLLGSIRE